MIRVEITSTQIRARVANRSLNSVEITGRLGTNRGQSIVNQTVTLSAGTQEVSTRTEPDGTFTASLELSRGSLNGGGSTVTVTFAGGDDTNLASASTFVSVPPAPVESVFDEISSPEQQLPLREILIIFAVIATSGGVLAVGRYRGWFDTELPSLSSGEGDVTADESSATTSDYDTQDTTSRSTEFTTPREQLNRGEVQQAVLHSYGQIWDKYQTWVDTDPQSHWELYNAVESTSLDVDESLYELTTVYEQSAYSPTTPDFRAGRIAIEAGQETYDALADIDIDDNDSDAGG